MDSAACLAFAISRGESVDAIHVQYGQAAAARELQASEALCEHFAVSLRVVQLGRPYAVTAGYLAGRNLLLISAAVSQEIETGLLYLGFHLDAAYPDCGTAFVSAMQKVLDVYHGGALQLFSPFLASRKATVAAYCVQNDVPLGLSYSCELGTVPPCGECMSCRDRKAVGV